MNSLPVRMTEQKSGKKTLSKCLSAERVAFRKEATIALKQQSNSRGKPKGANERSEISAVELVSCVQSNLALNPPSIYFDNPNSKEKSDDEGNYKIITLPKRKRKRNSKNVRKDYYRYGVSDETPKIWVQRRIREVINDYPLEVGKNQKAILVLALLRGRAGDKFWHALQKLVNQNETSPEPDRKSHDELSSMAMKEVHNFYFPKQNVQVTRSDKSAMSKSAPLSNKRWCPSCGGRHYASDCMGYGPEITRRKQWCPFCGLMHYSPSECHIGPSNPQA